MDEERSKSLEKVQKEAEAEQEVLNTAPDSMEAMQKAALEEQLQSDESLNQPKKLKEILNRYLFDMSSSAGKWVNYSILVLIMGTVFLSMLDTLPNIHEDWANEIFNFQIMVLYIFLIEYFLRIYAAHDRRKYIFGFFGAIDFLTVLPLLFGSSGLAIMRLFRLLRIMKLAQYFPVLTTLLRSVSDAGHMILAVLATITAVSVFAGNIAYILEPETFKNAFIGCWWSLVTMSTVGYGDMVPHTAPGMILGSVLILVGICVVAMMTAVIAVRIGRMVNMNKHCLGCDKSISAEYKYCPHCSLDQSDEIDLFSDDE